MPVKVGFEKALRLFEENIPTAIPVAYLFKSGLIYARGFLITKRVPNITGKDLIDYLKIRSAELRPDEYLKEKRALLKELAFLIARLMKLDFYLPDLRVSNILVERISDDKFRLWVIGLVDAEDKKPREGLMLYHLIANPLTARLFTGTDKIRFLKWYISFSGGNQSWSELCQKIDPVLKAWWEKWLKRRAEK